MSYGSLKTVAGWTVAAEDEKTMQWIAVLEPDQCRKRVAASTVSSSSAVQSNNSAVFSES